MGWLARVFASAFVRKVAFILAAALMGLVLGGHRAHAQAPSCFVWVVSGFSGTYATLADATSTVTAYINANASFYGCTNVCFGMSSSGSGAPTASGQGAQIIVGNGGTDANGAPILVRYSTQANSQAGTDCPTNCQGLPNKDLLEAIAGNTGRVAGSICNGGCGYTNSAAAMNVGGAKSTVYGQAIPTGQACGTATAMAANCGSSGGVTLCYDAGTNKVSVSGDVIAKTDQPAVGSCVIFASGGSMCTYTPDKPLTALGGAPTTDGTTVDVPVAVVTTGALADGSGGTKSAYFTAAQNAASPSPTSGIKAGSGQTCTQAGTAPATCVASSSCVASGPGVTPVVTCVAGTGSGGTGSGTGTGTGANGANGDCGASSVNCAGDSGTPALTRDDTVQSNIQGYIDSMKASPIMVAMGGIASAFPTGAPVPTVPIVLNYKSFIGSYDAFSGFAAIWQQIASSLRFVFLAMWAVAGIRVILSA